jgi:hypothetical protein
LLSDTPNFREVFVDFLRLWFLLERLRWATEFYIGTLCRCSAFRLSNCWAGMRWLKSTTAHKWCFVAAGSAFKGLPSFSWVLFLLKLLSLLGFHIFAVFNDSGSLAA